MKARKMTIASTICFTLTALLYVTPALAGEGSLVGQLAQQLGVTRQQAKGGAGSIFNYAKSKLSPDDFGQITAVVPNLDRLLKAAPAASGVEGMASSVGSSVGGMLGGQAGGTNPTGGLASLAGAFSKLGLGPEMVQQFVPPILSYVEKYGGSSVKNLLASVLS